MPASSAPPQYCLLNWGRLNALRLNYTSTQLYGSIGGVPLDPTHQAILIESLSVSDRLNEEPNTLIATIRGAKPSEGQAITLMYGSLNANAPLFAGTILRVTQVWAADNPKYLLFHIEATDPTWRLNEILVTARYRSQSASATAADLLGRFAPAGYIASIEPALPALDEITFTNTKLMDALVQLANRIGGYAFCDYRSVVHLWTTADAVVPPLPLTATHPSVSHVSYTRDLTQIVTRAIVQGGGANALARLPPGSTEIPVEDATWYNPSGGLVVSGPQRIQYTGTRAGGGGALVGSGGAPSSALALAATSGGAIEPGRHDYYYSWVSALGETVAGPVASVTITSTPAPGVGPDLSIDAGAGLVAPGTYRYGSTNVLPDGESPVAGDSPAVCTVTQPSPLSPPTVRPNPGWSTNIAGRRDGVIFRVSYRSTTGVSPAIYGPPSAKYWFPDTAGNPAESCIVTIPPVTSTGGAVYADLHYQNQSTDNLWRMVRIGFPVPMAPTDLTMGNESTTTTNLPVDTGGFPKARVTVIVKDGGAGVTARRVYRTKKDGTQKYLLREVAGSAQTQFLDTTADSALVTPAPAGVVTQQTVKVTGIALGPKGTGGSPATTARKLYRSTVAQQLKVLATINDNTTTTFTDTLADASLTTGTPPATDTSGLLAEGGQVLAGATTVPVSGTGAFPAAGGWVLSGNNRIHYTSLAGAALTGIPATGDGAIANTIPYGTPITLAPCLTGVPASGTGSIVWAILAGDPVDLVVIVDDLAAQATLQTLLGGSATGIREALIQDGRIGITEATARGQVLLQLQSAVLETLAHRSRDPNTVSGAMVSINLPAPTAITGTFRIQDVTVTAFNPHAGIFPTYDARSSSSRYTLEDLLRQLSRTDPPPTTGETP